MERYSLKHTRFLFTVIITAFLLCACYMPCTDARAAAEPPDLITAMDISGEFKDLNFRRAVWTWLGKTGEPGIIFEQHIQDRLPSAGYLLNVSNSNIQNLSGLEYFSGLLELICCENQITSLPPLPAALKVLQCDRNQLEKLPPLPSGLERLDCFSNELKALPSLPDTLKYLSCGYNQLSLLKELPAGLVNLNCEMNQLSALPDLPAGLHYLTCSGNQIHHLPHLPNTLTHIGCAANQLEDLPDLPENLVMFDCSINRLSGLPRLPDTLQNINCYDNQLTSLPYTPAGLKTLNCGSNRLSSISSLPEGIQNLLCSNNLLTSLPSLPAGLQILECENNRLIEIRNVPARIGTLVCYNNYLDVFAIALGLEHTLTSRHTIAPQLRLHCTTSRIELNAGESVELDENALMIQYCIPDTDGLTWHDKENADFSDLTLFSSDTGTASIDSAGNITGNSEGTCTIHAILFELDSELTKTSITVNVLPEEEEITDPPVEEPDTPSPEEEPDTPSPEEEPDTPSPEEEPDTPSPEEEPDTPSPEEELGPAITIDYSSASEWAVEELKAAVSCGLVTEKVASLLKQDITREEFCSIAVKLYEALSGEKAVPVIYNPFIDTSAPDVLKAYETGIVKGISANRFAPDYKITRQEICVMIYRAIRASKPELDYSTSGAASFADEDKIADWAIEEVRFASKNNIMKGTGGNRMSPLDNTSREQGIVLIKRTYEAFNSR